MDVEENLGSSASNLKVLVGVSSDLTGIILTSEELGLREDNAGLLVYPSHYYVLLARVLIAVIGVAVGNISKLQGRNGRAATRIAAL